MLSLSYRGRTTDGVSDNDVYAYLSLDGGNPDVDDAIFHLMGRITYDFDGDADNESDPFNSLNDINGHSLDSHLYEAFVDLKRSLVPAGFGLERIRVGRQDIYAAFTLPGRRRAVRLRAPDEVAAGTSESSVFGGIPEYLYEDSRSGDWIAGLDAAFKPWRDGRIDFRYAHVEDSSDWVEDQRQQLRVDRRSAQRFSDDLDVSGDLEHDRRRHARRVDPFRLGQPVPRPRDARRPTATSRRSRTSTRRSTTRTSACSGRASPTTSSQLDGSKLFCNEHLGLDAGISARMLQDSSNESAVQPRVRARLG